MSAVENTMTIDLQTVLPTLLPPAIQWAEARAREVELSCVLLKDDRISIARIAGVRKPEFIRIALVPTLPLPEHPDLRAAALQTVLLGPGMVGLTLGYSVLVCRDHDTTRLLSHEFRHVYQYESADLSVPSCRSISSRSCGSDTTAHTDAVVEDLRRDHQIGDSGALDESFHLLEHRGRGADRRAYVLLVEHRPLVPAQPPLELVARWRERAARSPA